jgi:hypothetical protein
MCYFSDFVVKCGNAWMFRRIVDKSKLEVKVGVEHLFYMVFNCFYIGIRFYMNLRDVLEVLVMSMLNYFLDWFFKFGDVNNSHILLDKLHLGFIIT